MLNQFEQYVIDNPNKDWNYTYLSRNENITFEIVQTIPDKDWDYFGLSQNSNITWRIVQDNPDIHWDYDWLSMNPNITWEIVEANPDKPWNFNRLSRNKFKYDKGLQYVKIKKIQHWYRSIKFLQKIHHIAKLNQVNTELKYLPDFGIKFFELKNDFESRI
jgi:hypothetical protein